MKKKFNEKAVKFKCNGSDLIGVITTGDKAINRGVVIIVGGGQYRVGAHRQFLLLARYLAKQGVSVFRFDARGMGDSGGIRVGFMNSDDDIRAAIDCFVSSVTHIREVVLWGLCDGATASVLYSSYDSRIKGLILVNPWVTTEKGAAKVQLKYYYRDRFFSKLFWVSLMKGNINFDDSLKSIVRVIRRTVITNKSDRHTESLPQLVLQKMERFDERILVVLSGHDMTAREFEDALMQSAIQKFSEPQFTLKKLADADHTFSQSIWRRQLEEWTSHWVLNGIK